MDKIRNIYRPLADGQPLGCVMRRPRGRPAKGSAPAPSVTRWRTGVRLTVLLLAAVALMSGCSLPTGSFDLAYETFPVANTVFLRGWSYDPDTPSPITVHVYIDGTAVAATNADQPRPDVPAVMAGAPGRTGFQVTVPAPTGTHEVCVYGIDASGDSNALIGCKTVDVKGMSAAACGARPSDPAAYQAM